MLLPDSVDDESARVAGARPKSPSSGGRTLRFGGKTIGFDAGPNSKSKDRGYGMALLKMAHRNRGQNVLDAGSADYNSSSTAETDSASNANASKIREVKPKEFDNEDPEAKRNGGTNITATNATSVSNESFGNRKVIHLDMSAVNRLLAFDEEEEDEADKEPDGDAEEAKSNIKPSQDSWRKEVANDLTNWSASRPVQRRHSIMASDMPLRVRLDHAHNKPTPPVAAATATDNLPEYRLNLQEMHSALKSEFSRNAAIGGGPTPKSANAPSLRLDEISHIRVVSSNAELHTRTISRKTRDDVERGKVCFVCMKTHFGLFSHGSKCEICKQTICHNCHTKMRIPRGLLTPTPSFTPKPTAPSQTTGNNLIGWLYRGLGSGSQPAVSNAGAKKFSVPDHTGLYRKPSSTLSISQQAGLSTISGTLTSSRIGPVGLPPQQLHYAPPPKEMVGRRMSLAAGSNVDLKREKLEESALLTVCVECKDVVLQVIRASRTSERMHTMHSMVMGLASS